MCWAYCMRTFFFLGVNDSIPIPTSAAVCPECGGALRAEIDSIEQLQVCVDVWEPDVPMLSCQNEETISHSDQTHEVWSETYGRVVEWMRSQTILIDHVKNVIEPQ